jgi:lysophospholipase L1-like esterase
VVFATTTPILDERAAAARSQADYVLLEASVEQYNALAVKVMQELQVPIDDLHAVFPDAASRSAALGADGVHFTGAGQLGLGKAIAAAIARHLPVQRRQ